jgi:hypothetical protein
MKPKTRKGEVSLWLKITTIAAIIAFAYMIYSDHNKNSSDKIIVPANTTIIPAPVNGGK